MESSSMFDFTTNEALAVIAAFILGHFTGWFQLLWKINTGRVDSMGRRIR